MAGGVGAVSECFNAWPTQRKGVFVTKKGRCCFCGRVIEGYGNNPDFLTVQSDGRLEELLLNRSCCDDCNENIVLPCRGYLDQITTE